jgi:hypothetical protein
MMRTTEEASVATAGSEYMASTTGHTSRGEERMSGGRRLAVRLLAILGFALFALFFGAIAAETMDIVQAGAEGSPNDPPPSAAARFGAAHPGEAVHIAGVLSILFIVESGLIGLVVRPHQSAFAYQVLAAMLGILVTLPIVGDPNNYGGQAGPIDPALLILIVPSTVAALVALPWSRWRDGEARRAFLFVAAIGAIPATWYGVNQALMQRDTFPPTADPHHNAHWWSTAIIAFMAWLVVAAAAAPSRGWRIGAVGASVAAIGMGLTSIIDGSAASSFPLVWGIASVAWGVGALVLGFRRSDEDPVTSDR